MLVLLVIKEFKFILLLHCCKLLWITVSVKCLVYKCKWMYKRRDEVHQKKEKEVRYIKQMQRKGNKVNVFGEREFG